MHARAKAVGEKLRALIMEKGWNQSELARRSGMRPSNVSNYLRGTNVPNPKQLAKLAEALETSPAEILNGNGETSGASHALCLTHDGGHDGHLRLQVDQVVPAEIATQVIGLLLARGPRDATERVLDARPPEERVQADQPAPPRRPASILDTLLPANPPKPINAKQVRQLDGPAEIEQMPRRRVV